MPKYKHIRRLILQTEEMSKTTAGRVRKRDKEVRGSVSAPNRRNFHAENQMKKITAILLICLGAFILAGCGGSDSGASDAAPAGGGNPGNVYRVITLDESGAPVAGTMVQFCSDQMCVMGETDADGTAVFEQDEGGMYTVKVFSVPEGFAEDKTEYPAPESYGDVNITLRKAE